MTTLDEMLIETATYCDVDIAKTGSVYTGESLAVVKKLTSALNYAINKIYRDKLKLEATITITLDENLEYEFTGLTQNLLKVLSVKDTYRSEYYFEMGNGKVYVPNGSIGGSYYLNYTYLPSEFNTDYLNDDTDLPNAVDMRIPCYYAAYFYLVNDSDDRAGFYLDLFNDGFNSINGNKYVQKRVKGRGAW